LQTIDRDPETKRRGRSAVVTSALLLYLDNKRRRRVDSAIFRAYRAAAGEIAAEIGALIEGQSWPKK
jgi:hypothetical protein